MTDSNSYFIPTSGARAVINYNGMDFSVNAEIADDLLEVIFCLDALGGSHLFPIPVDTGEIVRLWVTAGVPIVVSLPPEYPAGSQTRSYVEMVLQSRST
ncbi:hypothetical protein [Gordonia sp. NB41Y]|uniref:hypothetical protein n=1 Tax=Gordonia sp. NB41Y TaxID=875808 RepID=UPI0002BEECFB|nr:hypothetical protein [Gordonia sp. NB41Y]EMP15047.1 hypothetical protein ISGA_55 [Gordonia sp. NB41Y]WLP91346.1 hypothetical protein Q9K23_03480 [Gordonia sp. NB41Y]